MEEIVALFPTITPALLSAIEEGERVKEKGTHSGDDTDNREQNEEGENKAESPMEIEQGEQRSGAEKDQGRVSYQATLAPISQVASYKGKDGSLSVFQGADGQLHLHRWVGERVAQADQDRISETGRAEGQQEGRVQERVGEWEDLGPVSRPKKQEPLRERVRVRVSENGEVQEEVRTGVGIVEGEEYEMTVGQKESKMEERAGENNYTEEIRVGYFDKVVDIEIDSASRGFVKVKRAHTRPSPFSRMLVPSSDLLPCTCTLVDAHLTRLCPTDALVPARYQ